MKPTHLILILICYLFRIEPSSASFNSKILSASVNEKSVGNILSPRLSNEKNSFREKLIVKSHISYLNYVNSNNGLSLEYDAFYPTRNGKYRKKGTVTSDISVNYLLIKNLGFGLFAGMGDLTYRNHFGKDVEETVFEDGSWRTYRENYVYDKYDLLIRSMHYGISATIYIPLGELVYINGAYNLGYNRLISSKFYHELYPLKYYKNDKDPYSTNLDIELNGIGTYQSFEFSVNFRIADHFVLGLNMNYQLSTISKIYYEVKKLKEINSFYNSPDSDYTYDTYFPYVDSKGYLRNNQINYTEAVFDGYSLGLNVGFIF